jgi:2-polyprenyl-3-methyl-5-hydroxy-6-metoxy-1,4-benzoquinol methylase
MLFLDPYPGPAEVAQLYTEGYFTGSGPGLAVPGSDQEYSDFARSRLVKFRSTVELLRRFVPPPATLLDVGAATGEFLDIARKGGYEVAGIELSQFAAEQARIHFGLELFVGPLEAFAASPGFDIIHLSHVLEHFPKPHAAINRLEALLSDRGVVYVEVPFQWNWVEQLHHFAGRRQPFNVFSVHHRVFFRPATLKSLFERHGFVCRHLSLVPPNRYPVASARDRSKWAVWRCLSLAGQGLFIEAVFSRAEGSRGRVGGAHSA